MGSMHRTYSCHISPITNSLRGLLCVLCVRVLYVRVLYVFCMCVTCGLCVCSAGAQFDVSLSDGTVLCQTVVTSDHRFIRFEPAQGQQPGPERVEVARVLSTEVTQSTIEYGEYRQARDGRGRPRDGFVKRCHVVKEGRG